MEIKPNIQYVQLNLSSWKVWKIVQPGAVPETFLRIHRPNTRPTPLVTPKSRPPSICHIPLPTHQRRPLPSTRPLLLPCRWHCHSSRLSSRFCWPSTLGRGPVARAMAGRKTYDAINRTTCSVMRWHHFTAIITSESVRREGEQTLKLNFICKGRSRDRNSWTYVRSISIRSSGEGPGKARFSLNN